jgi:hypothetical protein
LGGLIAQKEAQINQDGPKTGNASKRRGALECLNIHCNGDHGPYQKEHFWQRSLLGALFCLICNTGYI